MPYLTEAHKKMLEDVVSQIVMHPIALPGRLNYLFTEVAKRYIDCQGESYQTYNDIIGALECCKLELYRRKVGAYEDLKIKQNGDIW